MREGEEGGRWECRKGNGKDGRGWGGMGGDGEEWEGMG